jgi:hypothetical protein
METNVKRSIKFEDIFGNGLARNKHTRADVPKQEVSVEKRAKRSLQTAAAVSALAAAGGMTIVSVRRREHGWGPSTPYGHRFDTKRITTLNGTVRSIARFRPHSDMAEGIELLLDLDLGVVPVHLGPTRWLHEFADTLKPGDVIEVTGCRVTDDAGSFLIATRLQKGEEVRELRAVDGRPLWRHDAVKTA